MCLFLIFYINEFTWDHLCLITLSTMFLRFIHIVMCINTSLFLWLDNIPFYGYTMIYLPTHPLMDIGIVSMFWAIVKWVPYIHIPFVGICFAPLGSRIVGSQGNSMFDLLRNCQSAFFSVVQFYILMSNTLVHAWSHHEQKWPLHSNGERWTMKHKHNR